MDTKDNRYSNMIDLPRPKAAKPMSLESRAAQFAPFAALTGYDEVVKQTADTRNQTTNPTNTYKPY